MRADFDSNGHLPVFVDHRVSFTTTSGLPSGCVVRRRSFDVVRARRDRVGLNAILVHLEKVDVVSPRAERSPVPGQLDLQLAARLWMELGHPTWRIAEEVVRDGRRPIQASDRLLCEDAGQWWQVHVRDYLVAAADQAEIVRGRR